MRAFALSILLLTLPLAASAAPDLLWTKTHDGGGNYVDQVYQAAVGESGDLFIGAVSDDGVGSTDLFFARLDRDTGAFLWTRRIPAFDDSEMAIGGLSLDGSGDVMAAAYIVGCVG